MNAQIALFVVLVFVLSGCATTATPDLSNGQAAHLVDAQAVESTEADAAAAGSADETPAVSSATTQQEWICRRERMTGTHYMVKICRPRYKIDEDMRKTQENMRDMQRSASNSGPIGN